MFAKFFAGHVSHAIKRTNSKHGKYSLVKDENTVINLSGPHFDYDFILQTGEKRSDLQSRGLCLVPSVILEDLTSDCQYIVITSETQPAVSLFAEDLQLNPFKD